MAYIDTMVSDLDKLGVKGGVPIDMVKKMLTLSYYMGQMELGNSVATSAEHQIGLLDPSMPMEKKVTWLRQIILSMVDSIQTELNTGKKAVAKLQEEIGI